jgi:hypothetical protein
LFKNSSNGSLTRSLSEGLNAFSSLSFIVPQLFGSGRVNALAYNLFILDYTHNFFTGLRLRPELSGRISIFIASAPSKIQ